AVRAGPAHPGLRARAPGRQRSHAHAWRAQPRAAAAARRQRAAARGPALREPGARRGRHHPAQHLQHRAQAQRADERQRLSRSAGWAGSRTLPGRPPQRAPRAPSRPGNASAMLLFDVHAASAVRPQGTPSKPAPDACTARPDWTTAWNGPASQRPAPPCGTRRVAGHGVHRASAPPRQKKTPGVGRGFRVLPPGTCVPGVCRSDQRRRLSTFCGIWLAWASMAVPACCRICVRDSSAVSLAKSVSMMRLREADRFSEVVCRLATTELKRFWIAPRSARESFTLPRALSMIAMACWAPVKVEMSTSPTKVSDAGATTVAVPPVMLKVVVPSLIEVNLIPVGDAPASAMMPSSAERELMVDISALAAAAWVSASVAPASTVMSPIDTPLTEMPLSVIGSPVVVGAAIATVPLSSRVPPRASELAWVMLSTVISW